MSDQGNGVHKSLEPSCCFLKITNLMATGKWRFVIMQASEDKIYSSNASIVDKLTVIKNLI